MLLFFTLLFLYLREEKNKLFAEVEAILYGLILIIYTFGELKLSPRTLSNTKKKLRA